MSSVFYHVKLGYDPRQNREPVDGPIVTIRIENYDTSNRYSAGTYIDAFDIICDLVWYQDPDARSCYWSPELDYLARIIDEFKSKKTAFTSIGGEVFNIAISDVVQENFHERAERHCEIRFSVRFGASER